MLLQNGNLASLQQTLEKKLESIQAERITYDLSSYDWHHIARQTKEIYNSLII